MSAAFNRSNTWDGRSKHHDIDNRKFWHELWDEFKDWLMEPIDFPGKFPEKCEQHREYNSGKPSDPRMPLD